MAKLRTKEWKSLFRLFQACPFIDRKEPCVHLIYIPPPSKEESLFDFRMKLLYHPYFLGENGNSIDTGKISLSNSDQLFMSLDPLNLDTIQQYIPEYLDSLFLENNYRGILIFKIEKYEEKGSQLDINVNFILRGGRMTGSNSCLKKALIKGEQIQITNVQ